VEFREIIGDAMSDFRECTSDGARRFLEVGREVEVDFAEGIVLGCS
jgi:hypothetical protein